MVPPQSANLIVLAMTWQTAVAHGVVVVADRKHALPVPAPAVELSANDNAPSGQVAVASEKTSGGTSLRTSLAWSWCFPDLASAPFGVSNAAVARMATIPTRLFVVMTGLLHRCREQLLPGTTACSTNSLLELAVMHRAAPDPVHDRLE